jgi:hypothetical protein
MIPFGAEELERRITAIEKENKELKEQLKDQMQELRDLIYSTDDKLGERISEIVGGNDLQDSYGYS